MKLFLMVMSVLSIAIVSSGCSSNHGPCASTTDCGSNQLCVFQIGSCSAVGQCEDRPTGPQCGAEEELCGCDGNFVITGCGFPSGFASGPTIGAGFTQCAADAAPE